MSSNNVRMYNHMAIKHHLAHSISQLYLEIARCSRVILCQCHKSKLTQQRNRQVEAKLAGWTLRSRSFLGWANRYICSCWLTVHSTGWLAFLCPDRYGQSGYGELKRAESPVEDYSPSWRSWPTECTLQMHTESLDPTHANCPHRPHISSLKLPIHTRKSPIQLMVTQTRLVQTPRPLSSDTLPTQQLLRGFGGTIGLWIRNQQIPETALLSLI